MIQPERINVLNRYPIKSTGKVVVYWMQQSQRSEYNHALEYAILEANQLNLPLVVFFGLTPNYPEANLRHYTFMLEGLAEVSQRLTERGIAFVFRLVSPEQGIVDFCQEVDGAMVVFDKGYLRIQRKWRQYVAGRLEIAIREVESEVVVPLMVASNKEEYAARTLRPKIHKVWNDFLVPLKQNVLRNSISKSAEFIASAYLNQSLKLTNISELLKQLKLDRSVGPGILKGGRSEAIKHLKFFLDNHLKSYAKDRNEPAKGALSLMSPYLHFGQISSLEIALKVKKAVKSFKGIEENSESYLEELIVRRELAMNFCYFNPEYDLYQKALPNWANKTLEKHFKDQRKHLYSLAELEQAKTHDEIWNASQNEMVETGKMHGYMRMYWGKKILEWSETAEEAFKIVIYLNDKYEIDGRDANGYAGIAWCFGKHDRPWGPERAIFGLVRYMNEAGIKRKIDWKHYVEKWGQRF